MLLFVSAARSHSQIEVQKWGAECLVRQPGRFQAATRCSQKILKLLLQLHLTKIARLIR